MMRLMTAVLLLASFNAVAEVTLTDINNNEVADAEVVMGNFNALNNAMPFVVASTDMNAEGLLVFADPDSQVLNDLSLTAPDQGVLVISGSVFIANYGPTEAIFTLDVLINGVSLKPREGVPYEAAVHTPAYTSGSGATSIQIAYTVTVQIDAGSHSVRQQILPIQTSGAVLESDDISYFYSRNNLTVQYYPNSQASFQGATDRRGDAPSERAPFGQ
jgi:hypothetical protein